MFTRLLLMCCLLSGLSPTPAGENDLTQAEREWIQQNPIIRVGAETDWPPFDFTVQGQATGYSNELLEALCQHVGLEIEYLTGPTFAELLTLFQQGELDVLPALWHNDEREAFTTFLPPYYDIKQVVFTRSNLAIEQWTDLAELRAVGGAGYNTTESIKSQFPEKAILEVNGPGEALVALSNGEADYFIGSLAVGNHYIAEYGLSGIQSHLMLDHSPFGAVDPLHIGVRKDLSYLASILRKAQYEIKSDIWSQLRQRWVLQRSETFDWWLTLRWVIALLALFSVASLMLTWHNSRLRHMVELRQQAADSALQQQAQLQAVMEAAPDAIWAFDHQYLLTTSNATFQHMYHGCFNQIPAVGHSCLHRSIPISIARGKNIFIGCLLVNRSPWRVLLLSEMLHGCSLIISNASYNIFSNLFNAMITSSVAYVPSEISPNNACTSNTSPKQKKKRKKQAKQRPCF